MSVFFVAIIPIVVFFACHVSVFNCRVLYHDDPYFHEFNTSLTVSVLSDSVSVLGESISVLIESVSVLADPEFAELSFPSLVLWSWVTIVYYAAIAIFGGVSNET